MVDSTVSNIPDTPTKPTISKEDRFKLQAGRRANKALKALKALQRCANPAAYSWTENQQSTLLSALETAVEDVRRAFRSREPFKPLDLG